jgi:hypothetical protein
MQLTGPASWLSQVKVPQAGPAADLGVRRHRPLRPSPQDRKTSKEIAMHLSHSAFGLMLLAFAASHAPLGAADKDKPADAPKEESVVPYDSKTHGALQVNAVSEKTAEWFDVYQNGKRAVPAAPPKLNTTIELAPGAYVVSVNRTERKVTIEIGKKMILRTGELLVKGKGGAWSPWQGKERKLTSAEPRVNDPLSLFAGKYTVKVFVAGQDSKELGPVEVKAGKRAVATVP